MSENEAYVRCWNNSDGTAPTHFITITDNCPCVQYSETTGNQVPHRAPAGDMCSQRAGHFHMSLGCMSLVIVAACLSIRCWLLDYYYWVSGSPGDSGYCLDSVPGPSLASCSVLKLAWRKRASIPAQSWPSRAADLKPHTANKLITV